MWSKDPWETPITDIKKKQIIFLNGTIISCVFKTSDTVNKTNILKKNKKREYSLLILSEFI